MVDVGARWVADGNLRLPGLVGVVLFADTILTFMVVGLANSANGKRDPVAILTFVLAYTAVLFSIVDLDRPQKGLINGSQSAMTDLLGQMAKHAP